MEALWSQFENVMAKDPDAEDGEGRGSQHEGEEGEQSDTRSEEAERR